MNKSNSTLFCSGISNFSLTISDLNALIITEPNPKSSASRTICVATIAESTTPLGIPSSYLQHSSELYVITNISCELYSQGDDSFKSFNFSSSVQ